MILAMLFSVAISETTLEMDTYPIGGVNHYVSFLIRDLPHIETLPSKISFTFAKYWFWKGVDDIYAPCKINNINIKTSAVFISAATRLIEFELTPMQSASIFPSQIDSVVSIECPYLYATWQQGSYPTTLTMKTDTHSIMIDYVPATQSPFFPLTTMDSSYIEGLSHPTINTFLNLNLTNSPGNDKWNPRTQDAYFEVRVGNCHAARVVSTEIYRDSYITDKPDVISLIPAQADWFTKERGSSTIFELPIANTYYYKFLENSPVKQYQIRVQFKCQDINPSQLMSITQRFTAIIPRNTEEANPIASIKEVKFINPKLDRIGDKVEIDQNTDYLQIKINNLQWSDQIQTLKLKTIIFDKTFSFYQVDPSSVCSLYRRSGDNDEEEKNSFADVDINLITLDDPANFNGVPILFPTDTSRTALIKFDRIELDKKWTDGINFTMKCKKTKIVPIWSIEKTQHNDSFVVTTLESGPDTYILRQNTVSYRGGPTPDPEPKPDPDPKPKPHGNGKFIALCILSIIFIAIAFGAGFFIAKRRSSQDNYSLVN
jgi:hypothetical protein